MVLGRRKVTLWSASPQGGQILLVVILVIIIASTIGLSLASRSITSLRTSTEEAESQKALAAAEAGIERVIQGNTPIAAQGDNPSNHSDYATQVVQIQSSSFLLNGGSTVVGSGPNPSPTVIPNTIPKDEGADIWFVDHDSNNTPVYSQAKVQSAQFLNLYWGSASEVCGTSTAPAAIQVIVVTRDPTLPDASSNKIKSYRYVYDGCSGRRSENKFAEAETGTFDVKGIPGVTFTNRTAPQNDLAKNVDYIIFVRVIPIYKDAVIGVSACNYAGNSCTGLPSQGYVITSTGTSGQSSRKLSIFKGYPQTYLPYLSYGLFISN